MEYYEDNFSSEQQERRECYTVKRYYVYPYDREPFYHDNLEDAEDELESLKKEHPLSNFKIVCEHRTISI